MGRVNGLVRRGVFGVTAAALLGAVLAGPLLGGCVAKPDPRQEFAMAMNGSRYDSRLREPIGYVQEIEAGFSTEYAYMLLFPLRVRSPLPRPGLEIRFDPRRILVGEEMSFGVDDPESRISLSYYPASGHKMSQGVLLSFAARRPDGGGTIRFDVLEPEIGGRVKGKILHATLYGFYENAHSAEIAEPRSPRKLELWNFPFDITLEPSPF